MKETYTSYFQKSKVFLYPLLKLKKGIKYVPIQTYVCLEHVYSLDDRMLICEYSSDSSESFLKFCDRYLKNHIHFHEYRDLGENKHLFVFNLDVYKEDFIKFTKGTYSKFSLDSKLLIMDFFLSSGGISDFIQGYFSPEFVHKEYAKRLGVDLKEIKAVHEVCSIPNIEKETFSDNNKTLNSLLENNSIHLEK
jgi:hypothetical protein